MSKASPLRRLPSRIKPLCNVRSQARPTTFIQKRRRFGSSSSTDVESVNRPPPTIAAASAALTASA